MELALITAASFLGNSMKVDKTKLKDSMGRPMTQALFLEIGYETDKAVFTLKDEDHTP